MTKKMDQLSELIGEGFIALMGLFILFTTAKTFCEIDSGFCFYGSKIFGIIFVAAYFILKYGYKK